MNIFQKILFPFSGPKTKFLENKWWHRLIKSIYFLIIGCGLIFSFIIYLDSNIQTIINPSYTFKGGRWLNQALQDTINQIPQEDFDIKHSNLSEEKKNVFMELRADIENVKNEGREFNINKLKKLYPELFEPNFGILYYTGYYLQIFVYTLLTAYAISIVLQSLYFKGIIYIIYGNKAK